MNWIQTFTGRKVFPFQPHPHDIVIADIAHALAFQCRYAGHVREFYSVAEHCCRIADALQDAGHDRATIAWGLMHDATEAYLVDIPRPVKEMLTGYKDAEIRLMACIAEKWGLAPVEPAVVKEYDTRILRNEAEALMSPAVDGWWNSITPLPLAGPIVPWTPLTAEQGFLARFRRWVG